MERKTRERRGKRKCAGQHGSAKNGNVIHDLIQLWIS